MLLARNLIRVASVWFVNFGFIAFVVELFQQNYGASIVAGFICAFGYFIYDCISKGKTL